MSFFDLAGIQSIKSYASIKQAYNAAKKQSQPVDRLIVFGSFYTVAGIN